MQLVENRPQSDELLRVCILRDVFDSELPCAKLDAHRHAPGDDDGNQACKSQEVDTESVLNVISLELVTRAVDITEVDATVGEDAVDIESDDTNRPSDHWIDHLRQRLQS